MSHSLHPIVLGGVAAWYHPAAGGRGVVIAPGHGWEDLCARPALTRLAESLAVAGLPTLRFDWRDTGESLDLAADDDRIAAWREDLGRMVEWMRRTVGVREVVVVGFRLGALLATTVAADLRIDRLVLLAPPSNGRAYGREQSVLARLMAVPASPRSSGDDLEIAGFPLSAATLGGLAALDPAGLDRAPATDVLIVAERGTVAADRLAAVFTGLGATVDNEPFDGWSRLMCDPTASEPPLATFDRVVEWIAGPGPIQQARIVADHTARHLSAAPPVLSGPDFEEHPIVFRGLVGVLCRPIGRTDPDRAAIILDSGRNHRIGWARQSVDLCRRLAAAGVSVLRFDFAGIGDSPARPEAPHSALYHDGGLVDITAALDEMERRGFRRVTLIGACSGAYQAFHAARAGDPRIAGLVMVNLLCFVWSARYAIHLSAWMNARPLEFEAELAAADSASHTKGPFRILYGLAKRIARPIVSGLGRLTRARTSALVESSFRAFAARRLPVSVVLSVGDRAVEEFESHVGPEGGRIADLRDLEIVFIPDADHSLTPPAARAALADHLLARFGRRRRAVADREDGAAVLSG